MACQGGQGHPLVLKQGVHLCPSTASHQGLRVQWGQRHDPCQTLMLYPSSHLHPVLLNLDSTSLAHLDLSFPAHSHSCVLKNQSQ